MLFLLIPSYREGREQNETELKEWGAKIKSSLGFFFSFPKRFQHHYSFSYALAFSSPGLICIDIHTGSGKLLEPASCCERQPTELGFLRTHLHLFPIGNVLQDALSEGLPACPPPDGWLDDALYFYSHCLPSHHDPPFSPNTLCT